jgi:hypothetical protein
MGGMRLSPGRALLFLPLAFFLLSLSSSARAQFWQKKDFHHWSARDCQIILTNSPWTQSYSAVAIRYTAEFFSALPVREAQVRLAQIESHYNRMSKAQKMAFDRNANHYLSVPYPKYTVIRVSYAANVNTYDQATLEEIQRQLQGYWQSMAAPKFRNSVYLSVDGKAVRVAQYKFAPAKEQAFFLFFPRQVNGKPLLGPSRKSVTLQITNPSLDFQNGFSPQQSFEASPSPAGSIQMEFKVKKMEFDGKIAY